MRYIYHLCLLVSALAISSCSMWKCQTAHTCCISVHSIDKIKIHKIVADYMNQNGYRTLTEGNFEAIYEKDITTILRFLYQKQIPARWVRVCITYEYQDKKTNMRFQWVYLESKGGEEIPFDIANTEFEGQFNDLKTLLMDRKLSHQ